MIHRQLMDRLLDVAKRSPVVTLTGPRQSGKTTLAKMAFPDFAYVNLDTGDQRAFATEDPRGFLARFEGGAILDEIQAVPDLFPYLQERVDARPGIGSQFVLTGSRNLALQQGVSQSLAGRSIQLQLLPFSLGELLANGRAEQTPWSALWKGGYPRIHQEGWNPDEWLPSYIENYLERDVRDLAHVGDLSKFRLLLQLLAGRIGQLVNLSQLGNEVGVDHKTISRWVSVLEASYIVFLLRPHRENFKKRLVKTPKIFFYDTGLACSLLRIHSATDLDTHYLRGGLFENYAIVELLKNRTNLGQNPSHWFWRDSTGHEVDLVSEEAGKLRALEIKGSATLHSSHLEGLDWYANLVGERLERRDLVYAGEETFIRSHTHIHGWKKLGELVF
jgi:predicted AAA+ superfamily ATPase